MPQGLLIQPGQIHVSDGDQPRWYECRLGVTTQKEDTELGKFPDEKLRMTKVLKM